MIGFVVSSSVAELFTCRNHKKSSHPWPNPTQKYLYNHTRYYLIARNVSTAAMLNCVEHTLSCVKFVNAHFAGKTTVTVGHKNKVMH